jgi:5'(3')-deoxyribonucleotidase
VMRVVLLDVDGVLADFVGGCLRGDVGAEDIRAWDVLESLPAEYRDEVFESWHREGWCRGLGLYPGAREAVMGLRDVARVLFVTSPMSGAPHWMWERDRWLREHLNATSDEIVFATAKHHVCGDVFVDDRVANVLDWHRHHPLGLAVLWRQPYNEDADLPSAILHTDDWSDVMREVCR